MEASMTTDEQPIEEEPPPNWKLMPILSLDVKTIAFGEESKVIEVALLQYEVTKKVSFTKSWLINPGEISWDDPVVVQALKEADIGRELLQSAPSFRPLFSMVSRLQVTAAVWCGHGLGGALEAFRQEFERAEKAIVPVAGKLLLDIAVMDRGLHPDMDSYNLEAIAGRWEVEFGDAKGSLHDAVICNQILKAMMEKLPDDPHEMMVLHNDWAIRIMS
jgi:DNA polymerase III epsilon subunit-like protein